jgi:hypothetical protein
MLARTWYADNTHADIAIAWASEYSSSLCIAVVVE